MVIYLSIIAFVVGGLISFLSAPKISEQVQRAFTYSRKGSIATPTELIFYRRLLLITKGNYAIVPQAHLSSFLDEKTKGQNWKRAFYAINSKSVDFLVCEKDSLRPLFAIELDDYTHKRYKRVQRDGIVNDIMAKAKIPLVRFEQGEWDTEQKIFDKIERVAMSTQTSSA